MFYNKGRTALPHFRLDEVFGHSSRVELLNRYVRIADKNVRNGQEEL
jgi:hypothetical protein